MEWSVRKRLDVKTVLGKHHHVEAQFVRRTLAERGLHYPIFRMPNRPSSCHTHERTLRCSKATGGQPESILFDQGLSCLEWLYQANMEVYRDPENNTNVCQPVHNCGSALKSSAAMVEVQGHVYISQLSPSPVII